MTILEGTGIRLENDGGVVVFSLVGGVLTITGETGVDAIVFNLGGNRIEIEQDLVRVDGGARVEVHGDSVLRLDGGGTGYTFMPESWVAYFPYGAAGFLPAPPEHPDTGGVTYSAEGTGHWADYLEDYYALFPHQRP